MSEKKQRTNFTCFVTALRLAITAPDEERQRAAEMDEVPSLCEKAARMYDRDGPKSDKM